MPTERRAAVLPVEAALEVGIEPTFHHDAEHSTMPYFDHSELAREDSEWDTEDSSSSSENEDTPTSSRTSINVYSAYSHLQQKTQYVVLSSNSNVHTTCFTLALARHVEITIDVTYGMQVCILHGMHNFLPSLKLICFGNIPLQLYVRNHRDRRSMFSMSRVSPCSVCFFPVACYILI